MDMKEVCAEEKARSFRADVHIHSEYSHDSVCSVSDIIQAGKEKQMDVLCITDHCDLHYGLTATELLESRKQIVMNIARSAAECKEIKILTGIELGGGFFMPEIAQSLTDSQLFDMVIGSVHSILFRGERTSTGKFDFGSADEKTMLEFFDSYMDATVYVAENLDIDVLGHLTYIFRHINGKYQKNLDWRIQEDKIRRIFRALIARNIALEINTSCLGSFYDEWMPAKEIVDVYIEMGGTLFTLGSDAHISEKIGNGFEVVRTYLRQKGISDLVYFEKRIPHKYKI